MTASQRMAVNAAITYLISGQEEGWLESARLVASFGYTITDGSVYAERHITQRDGSSTVEGYAEGVGNVSLQDRKRTTKEESSSGQQVERIGLYKMIHRGRTMVFWNYRDGITWKNDDAPGSLFHLFCDASAEPHTLALPVWEQRKYPLFKSLLYDIIYTSINLFRFATGSKKWFNWEGKIWTSVAFEVINSTRYPPGAKVENP